MTDFLLGIVVGFCGTWVMCAVIVLVWIGAGTILDRRQRRRGMAGL